QRRGQPMAEFVAVTNQSHAEPEASKRSKQADHGSLTEENPNDLRDVCSQRFDDPDLAAFLHGYGDERAHDPERGHNDNEEQQKEHNGSLESNSLEILPVHVDPCFGKLRRGEEISDLVFHPLRAVRVVGFDGDAMKRIAQAVEFLTDVERDEQEL